MDDTHLFGNKSQTTADSIANSLREEILRGELEVSQGLRQDKIAKKYGVSAIPVREALFQLAVEGLVAFVPNRGAFVAPLSARELYEIFAMRDVLETLALKHAIPNLTDSVLARADGLLVQMDSEKDIYKWGELNWEFHATLYKAARMPRLMRNLRRLHVNVIRYIVYNVPNPDEIEYRSNNQVEHRQILDACRQRDIDIAGIYLRRHLEASSKMLVRFLDDEDEDGVVAWEI